MQPILFNRKTLFSYKISKQLGILNVKPIGCKTCAMLLTKKHMALNPDGYLIPENHFFSSLSRKFYKTSANKRIKTEYLIGEIR